jgi:hypothetical protein
MLARLTVLFSVLLSAAVFTACGDDAAPGGDACVGHACGGTGASIMDPEGGNVILERMTLDTELQAAFKLPAGQTTMTRVIGYFMSAHAPDSNPLPAPGVCTNLAANKGWPAYVASQRTDVDVGTLTFSGKNAAGADVSFEIPKQAKGSDQIGRPHDVFYQFLQPDVALLLKADSFYNVTFGGVTGGMPATTFPSAMYLAADHASVQNPGIEDNGPLIAGKDFPVSWTPAPSPNKPPPADLVGGDVLGLTWLLDITGSPIHVCIVPASAGQFVIPGAIITEWKTVAASRGQPVNKMIMLRNAVAHQLVRLPTTDASNKRRIDMVSLECWAQVMDVQ